MIAYFISVVRNSIHWFQKRYQRPLSLHFKGQLLMDKFISSRYPISESQSLPPGQNCTKKHRPLQLPNSTQYTYTVHTVHTYSTRILS